MKCQIVGDTHFDNPYKGYLESQINTCIRLLERDQPDAVVFLGDIFHHRKPNPEVINAVFKFFEKISLLPGLKRIFVLRGNHDSTNKSDDGSTILEILEHRGSKVTLIRQTAYDEDYNFLFIPHYENEETIKESLKYVKDENTVVFGHFGYTGCMNSTGFFDFALNPEDFKNPTYLGHIHRYAKTENTTILGTPYSTNFGECDYSHFTGCIEKHQGSEKWTEIELKEVDFGVRHYVCPYESLEVMKDEINDPKFFTILRVFLSKFSEESSNDVRKEILDTYKIGYVDLKFQPIYDKKLNNRLSDYNPTDKINDINDDIIELYLEENVSSIPKEELQKGLDIIKQHESQES